jgi:Coenzyme PQQ synthesis protein D (PqqD)
MSKDNSHLRTVANTDGAAILDTVAGQITTLNSAGAFVWQALERGEDLEAIAASMARETGEQIEAIKNDLRDFTDALRNQNLLSC